MKREDLRALLEGAGIRPRRSAGQNFLVEEDLAEAIARDGLIEPEDLVLEIGTGFGPPLAAEGGEVIGGYRGTSVRRFAMFRLFWLFWLFKLRFACACSLRCT